MDIITRYKNTPIEFVYSSPNNKLINDLKQNAGMCVIKSSDRINAYNAYYQQKFPGSLPSIYTRDAIAKRLNDILDFISPNYGLYLFDIFRTLETQQYLFDMFREIIQANHPSFTHDELISETKKYVAMPNDPDRNAPPAHNTGGAIDLNFYDLKTGELLDCGCAIDTPESISNTCHFEMEFDSSQNQIDEARWKKIRENRRFLFHTMKQFNFINLPTEWWHYDLGNFAFANTHNIPIIFDSLEQDILKHEKAN